MLDGDFEARANFTCFSDPGTCPSTVNGVSMSFFYKRAIPMNDVYLKFYADRDQFGANKETLFSSGKPLKGITTDK